MPVLYAGDPEKVNPKRSLVDEIPSPRWISVEDRSLHNPSLTGFHYCGFSELVCEKKVVCGRRVLKCTGFTCPVHNDSGSHYMSFQHLVSQPDSQHLISCYALLSTNSRTY